MKRHPIQRYYKSIISRLLISMLFALIVMLLLLFLTDGVVNVVGGWWKNRLHMNEADLVKFLSMLYAIISMTVFVTSYIWQSMRRNFYIRKIVRVAEKIAKGDLSERIPVLGHDELTYLAMTINTLIEDTANLIRREQEQEDRKQELITQMAHDLRTPLTSVYGYLKIIEEDVEMDPDQERAYLATACRKAEQLKVMIEDLFEYTKLCDDDFPLQKSTVDMVCLIEQVADEMYPIFEDKGIECTIHTDVKSLPMNVDAALMARLFDNLLNNAVKYGADGKKIIIRLQERRDDYLFMVTNYGDVIAQEDLSRLFEKFYRTDQSRSSSTGGTGLGLAIASNIVRLHGGQISCTSDETNGTSFIISLPSSLKA